MKKVILVIFLVSCVFGKIYKDIKFISLIHLSNLSALEISGLDLKKDISEDDIDKAIVKLFKQGYFNDIKVMDENSSLVFYFKEKPTISEIHYEGINESEVEDKIKPIVSIKKGEIFTKNKIQNTKRKLIQIYRSEGFFDTVVEVDSQEDNISNTVDLSFYIKKGDNIIITKQDFEGIKKFSQDDIELDLANKEEDTVPWWFGQDDGKLKLDQIEFDYHRVKNFYMKHGYLDVYVTKPLLSVDFDQYSANIHYFIKEGIQYRVGKTKIEVIDSNLTIKDDLQEEFKLKQGRIFNIEKMRKDIKAIQDYAGSKGYAYAQVFPDIKKNKKTKIADVIYTLRPGKKVYIRDVIISGNSKTLDRVIRREVFLAPKDLYNSIEIQESKKALKRLGFFKSVKRRCNCFKSQL
jgi:outer membrane protein insertion porin family